MTSLAEQDTCWDTCTCTHINTHTLMYVFTLLPWWCSIRPDRKESGFIQVCVSFFVTCHFSSLHTMAHPSSTDWAFQQKADWLILPQDPQGWLAVEGRTGGLNSWTDLACGQGNISGWLLAKFLTNCFTLIDSVIVCGCSLSSLCWPALGACCDLGLLLWFIQISDLLDYIWDLYEPSWCVARISFLCHH